MGPFTAFPCLRRVGAGFGGRRWLLEKISFVHLEVLFSHTALSSSFTKGSSFTVARGASLHALHLVLLPGLRAERWVFRPGRQHFCLICLLGSRVVSL